MKASNAVVFLFCLLLPSVSYAAGEHVAQKEKFYSDSIYNSLKSERALKNSDFRKMCGAICLYIVNKSLSSQESEITFSELLDMCKFQDDGLSFADLFKIATELGLNPKAYTTNLDSLFDIRNPLIVMINEIDGRAHYVVFLATESNDYRYVIDYPKGKGMLSRSKIRESLAKTNTDLNDIPIMVFQKESVDTSPDQVIAFSPAEVLIDDIPASILGEYISTVNVLATNMSDHAVNIEKVGASCGCMSASLSRMNIPPHETATLVGEVKSNPGENSTYRFYLTGKTDKGIDVQSAVKVRVRRIDPIFWSCEEVSFGFMAQTETKQMTIDFYVEESSSLIPISVNPNYRGKDYVRLNCILSEKNRIILDGKNYEKYAIQLTMDTDKCSPGKYKIDMDLELLDSGNNRSKFTRPVRFEVLESF